MQRLLNSLIIELWNYLDELEKEQKIESREFFENVIIDFLNGAIDSYPDSPCKHFKFHLPKNLTLEQTIKYINICSKLREKAILVIDVNSSLELQ